MEALAIVPPYRRDILIAMFIGGMLVWWLFIALDALRYGIE